MYYSCAMWHREKCLNQSWPRRACRRTYGVYHGVRLTIFTMSSRGCSHNNTRCGREATLHGSRWCAYDLRGSVFLDTVDMTPEHKQTQTVHTSSRGTICTCTLPTSVLRVIVLVCCKGENEQGEAGRIVCDIALHSPDNCC